MMKRRLQRGAVVVETVIVMPILLLFTFAIAEYGTLASDKMGMQVSVRTAARLAGSLGTEAKIDYFILDSIYKSKDSIKNGKVTDLLVFRPQANGQPTVGCLRKIGQPTNGVANQCNHYKLSTNLNLTQANFTSGVGDTCTSTDKDRFYCPSARLNDYTGSGPENIGILLVGSHTSITQIVYKTSTMRQQLVVQLDPDTRTA